MRRQMFLTALAAALMAGTSAAALAEQSFNRIATFPVVANLPADRDAQKKKTVAEIIAASEDGNLLVYTDSPQNAVGFVDITDPRQPKAAGFLPVGGEPTSVTVIGGKAFVAVNTSKSYKEPDGVLAVVDLAAKNIEATCALGGQPDSIAASPDKAFLAIAIENERDEELNKSKLPQLPAGNLTILPVKGGAVDCAGKKTVDLTGLAGVAPEDPEPEFVAVNGRNEVVVTLQENNHIAVVDLATAKVVGHLPAGTVTLEAIDTRRDKIISATGRLENVKREPDAVKWLDDERFVTANEGDYEGGSRGFTIFRKDGTVEYDSGNALEHLAMRIGHFPEKRADKKGIEPEGIEVARYGDETLIFVGTERSSFVAVYRDAGPGQAPQFLQVLPSGIGPEGLLAIPQRNLFVTANETDLVEDGGPRATVMIYERSEGAPVYPMIASADDAKGLPIAWGALSGLAADGAQPGRLFAVTDSAYAEARILEIDAAKKPAVITRAITVTRDGAPAKGLDIEGIAWRPAGGFWLASEGNPEKKDVPTHSSLVRVDAEGAVVEEVALPETLAAAATRFGFEGVAVVGEGADETVYVAVQREWKDDPKGFVKILTYKPATKAWGVLRYPLDAAPKGWMGLSELTYVGNDTFAVIERDNQFGDKAVKTLQAFSVKGLTPVEVGEKDAPVVEKRVLRDLMPDLASPKGYVLDKVESFAVDAAGDAFIITDNDGVDDASGETVFLNLGRFTVN
ncbi:Esterase-like activity of phytase [Chelatococcus sambhunathii]|uniref:Esterase-like activity of phytase n=1 Tax=Chelatococcus sambhunathii TaxID=363953 RepID=A0ABP2A0F2_9HYPH|nr:esterase-like activity of phytase family protein [Chelatococcus sambhunathii]CUA83843.1 Esterase-like activity of phytase [Chelatococcus sambhunathii]